MAHAIESILPGGEDVEIIIVNDGSKDRTSEIAHEYMEKYPTIIKVVDKENGGHGDAVNSGLMHATGKYFKVVDSDDWVDEDALHKILDVLRHMEEDGMELDMLIANYVYEKVGATHKKVIHYRNVLPQDEIFRWDDMGHFRLDQYILMHSVIYRTDMLKLIQLHLPKHTFYVDNIYVYYPLPHVRKIYYMDVDFYRYFIGREDQSVNEKVMIKRLDQQIFVTKTMIDMYQLKDIGSKKLRQYMLNYLAIMMTVSSILCIRSKNKENLEKKKALCEKAEALKDSTDWKATADALTKLQKEWKTIGPVAKKHSDAVWKRFISACDYFFDQKNKATSSQRSVEVENMEKKKALIEKLSAIDENMDMEEASTLVRELMKEWNSIGHVPFKEKDKLYKQYHSLIDQLFDRFNINTSNKKLSNFRSNISNIQGSGPQSLYREREKLVRAYENMKNELQTYENNLGFLTSTSKKGSSLLTELNRKVDKLKADLDLVLQKIKVIDESIKTEE